MGKVCAAVLFGLGLAAGCQGPQRVVPPIERSALDLGQGAAELVAAYGSPAFVYRKNRPGPTCKIYSPSAAAVPEVLDDTNLVIFAEGSGDQPQHFLRTAELIAQSRYHPAGDSPNLLILLVHWSESTSVVKEHLNFEGQSHGADLLRRMCALHQQRHPRDGLLSIIGFSAGTRVAQLAFGARLPDGRRANEPPVLTGVPDSLRTVDHVVYLGSSLNRDDPLPFETVSGRFINFVNHRDTHYGDRAPYYAPAGTSPIYGRVLEANLYLARPNTGASANGFSRLATLTSKAQFEVLTRDPAVDRCFKMINVAVPPQLIPWSVLSVPILDDDLDTYMNLAPNHYSMVGRGPEGGLASKTFDQYKDLSYEFVREQVACAALRGRVNAFELGSEPKPNILPSLINPANLILSIQSQGGAPVPTPPPDNFESPPESPADPQP